MYNLRYHIVTVTAIFVALAIGLLLGVAIGRSNAVQATTDSLVSGLRDSLDVLQDENDALSAQAREAGQLNDALVGAWTSGRLAERDALVLGDAGSAECVARVTNVLGAAGATVHAVTLALPDTDDSSYADVRAGLSGLLPGDMPEGRAELADMLGEALAAEWGATAGRDGSSHAGSEVSDAASTQLGDRSAQAASGAGESQISDGATFPLTDYLRSCGVLATSSSDAELASCSLVVDVAVERDGAAPLSLALTAALTERGVPAVATQLSDSEASLVQDAWAHGVSGMAAVDEAAGAYGVVALLSGAVPGAYGVEGRDPWPSVPDDVASAFREGDLSASADAAARAQATS